MFRGISEMPSSTARPVAGVTGNYGNIMFVRKHEGKLYQHRDDAGKRRISRPMLIMNVSSGNAIQLVEHDKRLLQNTC